MDTGFIQYQEQISFIMVWIALSVEAQQLMSSLWTDIYSEASLG